MPVFKTGALNRSAISPQNVAQGSLFNPNIVWFQLRMTFTSAVFKVAALVVETGARGVVHRPHVAPQYVCSL